MESQAAAQIEKKEEIPEKSVDESQESDEGESSDEEIVLDEPSDTENYATPHEAGDEDDVSCSSGEEEEGVTVAEVNLGGVKLQKLKFKDVEAKRLEKKNLLEDDAGQEEADVSGEEEVADEDDKENKVQTSFKDYRTSTILDEQMENDYKSGDDDDFDPIFCGETLSDVEYVEGDERDTESEPETEEMEGSHKKTGETLFCIKMIEELKIPPQDGSCSPEKATLVPAADQLMECS